ncbi:MAG TPA: hypothetical protein VFE98_04355 [Candidatus Bathyarchaeia archaeon]|nr:hypothetical protein [Candidatus Bathyarchaeia archaeon]
MNIAKAAPCDMQTPRRFIQRYDGHARFSAESAKENNGILSVPKLSMTLICGSKNFHNAVA